MNEEFEPAIMSRLNRPKDGPVLIIAHRLAPNDLSGFLLEQGGWEHIALPFIAPVDANYGTWNRKKFQLLRPDHFSEADVARIKASARFATLYQQLIDADEELILPEHFPRYFDYAIPRKERAAVLSVDASLSDGPNSSFNVIQAWCRKDNDHYLLEQWRARGSFVQLREAYDSFCRRHNPVLVLIEKTANGIALIEHAKKRRSNSRVIEIVPDRRTKLERLSGHLGTIRSGRIKLPREGGFVEDYLAEFCAAYRATFDQIDATVQYLEAAERLPPLRPPQPRATGIMKRRGQWR